MSVGGKPWLQTHWDWHVALNFLTGGSGSGLLLVAALGALAGPSLAIPTWVGLLLVAGGLAQVSLHLGRPLRGLNVLFNPHTSWMTREAFVAGPLLALGGLAALLDSTVVGLLVGLLAAAFLYCQARILKEARGRPDRGTGAVPADCCGRRPERSPAAGRRGTARRAGCALHGLAPLSTGAPGPCPAGGTGRARPRRGTLCRCRACGTGPAAAGRRLGALGTGPTGDHGGTGRIAHRLGCKVRDYHPCQLQPGICHQPHPGPWRRNRRYRRPAWLVSSRLV